jgi:glycosyltransferase involved in cell wall biosynthesis
MRVGVNLVGLPPRAGGVEALYLRNVLNTLREERAATEVVLFTDPENHGAFEDWERACIGQDYRSIEQAVKATAPEVVFASLESAPTSVNVPLVLYALELHTGDNGAKRHWFGSPVNTLKRAAHSASALVVPSKYLQQECLRVLEVPMDKVVVAPFGTDTLCDPAEHCFVRKPFLLAAGDASEIQSVSHIMDALDRIPEAENHILVVVGDEIEGEPRCWGDRVLRVEFLPDNHLAALYQHSAAYVYPALRPGAALGILQAMRAGARVVAPKAGGIPEMAGSVALYFDPKSMTSLVTAIQRALTEGAQERAAQIRFGKQTAAAYTWENCAWKTLSALRRA